MDIQQWRYFVAVAEYLSFTGAARALYITQPALSSQIADLENYLGVVLFLRNKRSVQLSAVGEALLPDVYDILSRYDRLVQKARNTLARQNGNLTVGYLSPEQQEFLPKLIRSFSNKYPEVKLSFTKASSAAEQKNSLLSSEVDIIFTTTVGLKDLPSLCYEIVSTVKMYIVMPNTHRLATMTKIKAEDLVDEKFILLGQKYSQLPADYLFKKLTTMGTPLNIISQLEDVETVLLQVEAGTGITFLSGYAKQKASSNLCFIELDVQDNVLDFDIAIAWQKKNDNPFIQLFRNLLRETLDEIRGNETTQIMQ